MLIKLIYYEGTVIMNEIENVENREILDTKSMIEESFFANLNAVDLPPPKPRRQAVIQEKLEVTSSAPEFDTERLLTDLFDIRDGLVDMFQKLGVNASNTSLADNINKVGACINKLGGKAENFNPSDYISGLQAPRLNKNASRVIENTKESYSLGGIDEALVADDGKTVSITFLGNKDGINYKAIGTIAPHKSWVGNEAIDYIYSEASGCMSVKTYNEDGKWVDKSANYNIAWELYESPVKFETKTSETKKEGNKENKAEIKEEIKVIAENKISDSNDVSDVSDISDDFNIEEQI
jgi:hypothetical protein